MFETEQMECRVIRIADFVAESIEAEASRIPDSMAARKEALLKMAEVKRQSPNQKQVRVWSCLGRGSHGYLLFPAALRISS